MLPARYVAKKWIDDVTKSRVLNEASLQFVLNLIVHSFVDKIL